MQRKILTDKLILLTEEKHSITLTGPLNDSVILRKSSTTNYQYYLKKYNLEKVVKTSTYHSEHTSIVLWKDTLVDYTEQLMNLLHLIEVMSFQLVLNKQCDLSTIKKLYTSDEQHETSILDCKIGHMEYNEIIEKMIISEPDFTKALLTMKDIRWLGESLRSELFHANYCINQLIVNAVKAAKQHQKHKKISEEEYRIYGEHSDATNWNFCDAVKSLSTSIDIVTSYIFYVVNLLPQTKRKIHRYIYKDFNVLFDKEKSKLNFPFKNLHQLHADNKELILIRNELTHNQQLGNIRQPLFLGHNTSVINNLNTSYIDIMLWDFENNNLCRSGGRCSFFKQRRNLLAQLKTYVEKSTSFIHSSLYNSLFSIKNSLLSKNITHISYPTNFTKDDLGLTNLPLHTITSSSDLTRFINSYNIKTIEELIKTYNIPPN